jgi:hypothetical protein
VFARPERPNRWDAKTGKELPPACKGGAGPTPEPLTTLRPHPALLIRDLRGEEPCVLESGTGTLVPRFRFGPKGAESTPSFATWNVALSPTGCQFASSTYPQSVALFETATQTVRRTLDGHRGDVRVLGFTPDGTRLLTAGGDHTVLVWDMRLRSVPLPEALKKETDAAKLWNVLATGKADTAYLAMARLAREPDAAVKMAKLKLKPAAKGNKETDSANLADARAIELLEALDTKDALALLKELAAGHVDAFRTQEAQRALERNKR